MKKNKKILEYNAVFTSEKDGGFSVFVPNLPGCFSQGDNFEDAQKNIKEAIELYLQPEDNKNIEIYESVVRDQFMAPVKVQLSI